MNKKAKIKSVDKKGEERGSSQDVVHERKCHTPSLYQKKVSQPHKK